jgi:transposase
MTFRTLESSYKEDRHKILANQTCFICVQHPGSAMKPYSTDMRTKVYSAYLRGESSQRALAVRFDVSLSFVRDLIRLHRETGDVAPRHNRSHGYKHFKVDPETLEFLFLLLNQQPRLSLSNLCEILKAERNVQVSRATLWRAIKRH